MNKRFTNYGLWQVKNGMAEEPAEILMYDDIGKDPWTGKGFTASDLKNAINAMKPGQPLCIRINSRGGDVYEGMAIKSLLDSHGGKKVAIIDGVAASTASWCALGCNEIHANKGTQVFMHDALAAVMGNAEDMEKAAEDLDKTSNQIAGFYADKCGKSRSEMRRLMKDETLLTADEAKKLGLVDKITTTNAIHNFAPEELTKMKSVLQAQNSLTKRAGETNNNTDTIMNREKMLALLNKWGVTIPDNATDEQLTQLVEAGKPSPVNAATDSVLDLKNEIEALKKMNLEAKRNSVIAALNKLVSEDKLPEGEKEAEIELCIANEKRLEILNARKPAPPGAPAVATPNLTSDAGPIETAKAFGNFSNALNHWRKGGSVKMENIAAESKDRAHFFTKHRNKLLQAMNTNTIATELKRQVILQDAIVDFRRRLLSLGQFSTVYQNVPLEGTNKVEVPFYDLDSVASISWNPSNGYNTGSNTTTDKREITIGYGASYGDRLRVDLAFTSEEIARQPFLNIKQLLQLKIDKLAYDIVTDVLGIVTVANYGTAAVTKTAATFDSDDIVNMKLACKTWPEMGRSLFLDSEYDAALLKDVSFKNWMNAASDSAIKEGRLYPRVVGFDYVEIPTIPTNSENLVGFAAWKSAILFATAPVPPVQEVRNAGTTYEIFVDDQTGIGFEYRTFGSNVLDTATHVVEVSYGFAKGNANALKAIRSAAP